LSRLRMKAVRAPTTTTAAPSPAMILVFFDMASNPPAQAAFQSTFFYGRGPRKFRYPQTVENAGSFR
jgi:hypothetical protein